MTYITTQSNLAVLQREFKQFRVSPICILQTTLLDNHIYISNAQPIHMDIVTEYISHVIWLFQ